MSKEKTKINANLVGVNCIRPNSIEMTRNKNNKGITLIALIITIIVMLILVGVSVSVALNGGLFRTAKEATDKTQIETDKEQLFSAAIGAIGTSGKVDFTKLDNNLPQGFTKVEEGEGYRIYKKSKNGNSFKVYENGTVEYVITVADLESKYEFEYYSSLNRAIKDNNGETGNEPDKNKDEAVAGLYKDENGNTVVMLLQDTQESETINITNDVKINLGGKTLSLTTANAYLMFTGDITASIDGTIEESTIKAENITLENYGMIQGNCSNFEINGGTYLLDLTATNVVIGITTKAEQFTLSNCTIIGDVKDSQLFYAIQLHGDSKKAQVNNCKVEALATTREVDGLVKFSSEDTIINNLDVKVTSDGEKNTFGIRNSGNGQMTIADSDISVDATTEYTYGVYASTGSNITLEGTNITANDTSTGTAYGIDTISNNEVHIADSNIKASSDAGSSVGIKNGTENNMKITNTEIFADATDANASSIASYGISNYGTLTFDSGTVTGTHSGLTTGAGSKTYVKGGTFTSCCHGGIYFAHGANGEAYVENATIECKEYSGKYPVTAGLKDMYGGFYIGGGTTENNSNMSAYLNNCTIRGGGKAFVLRGTSGETGNKVYISNSNIEENKQIRIDNDTLELYIGTGCNFNASNTNRASAVSITEDVYVKSGN